ncbi:MAG: helix-turn-helix domain-containing protein [Candidatus Kapabacteria bacterium]|jgi:AraC-like DNA-binding protein|nr:helix-turn-helix domain-containing protein [Candidatus Kapabacteria bacterium]
MKVLDEKNVVFNNILEKKVKFHPKVESIYEFVYDNYSDYDLSTDFISNKIHLSKQRVNELCSLYFKMTPGSLLCYIRMLAALKIMMNSCKNIKEIAISCGYQNQKTFYLNFKKSFKCYPTKVLEEINSSLDKQIVFEKYHKQLIKNMTFCNKDVGLT